MHLNDSFAENADQSDVQVNVRLVNIASDKNREMLEYCKPLSEYNWFVETIKTIKKKDKKTEIEDAVDAAVDEMPDDFLIKKFLLGNRAEVKDMCLTEYNEAETMQQFKEEGREEGRAEERKNTERERKRAEKAEAEKEKAEAEVQKAEAEIQKLKELLAKAQVHV